LLTFSSQYILIDAEIFVKAMVILATKEMKFGRVQSKIISLLGKIFDSLPVLFISDHPSALSRGATFFYFTVHDSSY